MNILHFEFFVIFLLLSGVCVSSYMLSQAVYKFARLHRIWDDPKSNINRKKQTSPVPLLGGTSVAIISCAAMSLVWLANKYNIAGVATAIGQNLAPFHLLWIIIAIGVLVIGGYFDDKYHVSPKWQVLFIGAALCISIFLGGLNIGTLSYPFDQILPKDHAIMSFVLTFCWLGFCVAATKFLDGLDGLVSTVGVVALLTIGSVSMFGNVNQPLILIFCLIWVAAIIGFLPFNFPHAKMYLGEGGSEIIGFIIGVLSILSGAKIATSGTVIGWFIIDLFVVWVLRALDGRNPLTSGDRLHWHFRLVDLGLSKITSLAITVTIILFTAHVGLAFDTGSKLYVIFGQVVFLLLIFALTAYLSRKHKNKGSISPQSFGLGEHEKELQVPPAQIRED